MRSSAATPGLALPRQGRRRRCGAGHDAALRDVALTSAYLEYDKPVLVVLAQTPLGTHYKLKAYPFDMRDQFSFVSDLKVRGKLAIADAGAVEIQAPASVPDRPLA